MKKTIGFLMIGAVMGVMSPVAQAYTAAQTAALKSAISADKSKVLQIVSSKVSESPEDAAAIVKAAIEVVGTDDPALVAAIVNAAMIAAPEKKYEIGQAAVVAAPGAASAIQAVLNNSGSSNPLNFPGSGIGPSGAFPSFGARGPLAQINPPETSEGDF